MPPQAAEKDARPSAGTSSRPASCTDLKSANCRTEPTAGAIRAVNDRFRSRLSPCSARRIGAKHETAGPKGPRREAVDGLGVGGGSRSRPGW